MSKTLLRHTLTKKIFLTFLLTPYLYTFSLYENPSFIIFSAERTNRNKTVNVYKIKQIYIVLVFPTKSVFKP
jgi:hypothetical protein